MLKRLLLIATISLALTNLNLLASAEHHNLDNLNDQVQDTIYKIQKNLGYDDRTLDTLSNKDHFSEEEIGKILEVLCKKKYSHALPEEDQKNLTTLKSEVVDKLKEYKVTGFSFCIDPNVALFYDNQNPQFTVAFKNQDGEVKSRTFQGSITSWGLKLQLAVKFNFIFFVGTDLDFYSANKTIELGTGIDLSIPIPWNKKSKSTVREEYIHANQPIFCDDFKVRNFNDASRNTQDFYVNSYSGSTYLEVIPLDLMYVPFKNISGGMIMVSIPLSVTAPLNVSIVTGGTLTPCK